MQLAPGPRFRDSDYIDMVSSRGAGQSDYGAGTRMFFKGQQQYVNTLPGPANCADTVRVFVGQFDTRRCFCVSPSIDCALPLAHAGSKRP
jgi:hypothetical protein